MQLLERIKGDPPEPDPVSADSLDDWEQANIAVSRVHARKRQALYRKLGALPGRRIQILPRERPRDVLKYGGLPDRASMPPCTVCELPLQLLLQFDPRDAKLAYLNLRKRERVYILSCVRCDLSYAGDLYYAIAPDGGRIEVLEQPDASYVAEWPESVPECAVALVRLTAHEQPGYHPDEGAWEEALRAIGPQHRLGGWPFFVQQVHVTPCLRCGRTMRYLGQIDSETWPGNPRESGHMFGDCGILYFQVCDRCGVFATGADCY